MQVVNRRPLKKKVWPRCPHFNQFLKPQRVKKQIFEQIIKLKTNETTKIFFNENKISLSWYRVHQCYCTSASSLPVSWALLLFSRPEFLYSFFPCFLFQPRWLHPVPFYYPLRRGCRAWCFNSRTIHPLFHCDSVHVSSSRSSVYCGVSIQFFGRPSFLYENHHRQMCSWEDLLDIVPARFWSKTVCKSNQVVGTVRQHVKPIVDRAFNSIWYTLRTPLIQRIICLSSRYIVYQTVH